MGGAARSRPAAIPGIRRLARAALCGAAAAVIPAAACASAWTQEKGRGQVILTQLYDRADRAYDANGDPLQFVEYDKLESSAFVEYGLLDRVTLVGRLALQDVYLEIEDGQDAARGLAASELGARVRLWDDDRTVVSAQGAVILPGAGENVANIFFGGGETDFEARLLAGRSFRLGGRPAFVDVQAGYRWRGGGFPDERRLDVTFGHDASDRLSLFATTYLMSSGAASGLADEYASARGQLSAVYWLDDNRGVQFGGLATLAGENIIQERAIFAAYWIRF